MGWKDRAIKVTDEPKKKSNWKDRSRANARTESMKTWEANRQANQQISPEMTPDPAAIAVGAAQGLMFNRADEVYAAFGGDIDAARKYIAEKEKESPVSFYGGMLGSPNPLNKVVKSAKAVGGVVGGVASGMGKWNNLGTNTVEGMLYATGEEDKNIYEEPMEHAKSALVGGAVGATVTGASSLLKATGRKVFGETSTKQAKHIGVSDATMGNKDSYGHLAEDKVMQDMDFLDEKNFFKWNKAEYDIDSLKFKVGKDKNGKTLTKFDALGNPSIRETSKRMKDAADKTNAEITRILDGKHSEGMMGGQAERASSVPEDSLSAKVARSKDKRGKAIDEVYLEAPKDTPVAQQAFMPVEMDDIYSSTSLRNFKRSDGKTLGETRNMAATADPVTAAKVDKIFHKVELELGMVGGEGASGATLKNLHKAKQRIYEELSSSYAGSNYDSVDIQVKKDIARTLKEMVNHFSGDPNLANHNEMLEKIYTYRGDVSNSVLRAKGTRKASEMSPFGSGMYIAGKVADFVAAPSRMNRMKMGQRYDSSKFREPMEATFRSMLPKGASQMNKVPYRPTEESEQEINPDSASSGMTPNIPNFAYLLESMSIPRTKEGIIANKDLIYAKAELIDPTLTPAIAHIIERKPELIADLATGLMQVMPELFEPQDVSTFDGKTTDPQATAIATNKTVKKLNPFSDGQKSATEIALELQKLHTTGEYIA